MTCQSCTVTASIEQLPLSQALLRHKSTLSSALNIITQKLGHEMECSCLWLGQVNAAKRWAWEIIPTVFKKKHTHTPATTGYRFNLLFVAKILIQNDPTSPIYNKSPPCSSFQTNHIVHIRIGSQDFFFLHEIKTDRLPDFLFVFLINWHRLQPRPLSVGLEPEQKRQRFKSY